MPKIVYCLYFTNKTSIIVLDKYYSSDIPSPFKTNMSSWWFKKLWKVEVNKVFIFLSSLIYTAAHALHQSLIHCLVISYNAPFI